MPRLTPDVVGKGCLAALAIVLFYLMCFAGSILMSGLLVFGLYHLGAWLV